MTSQRPAAIACIKEGISGGSSLTDDRAAQLGEAASQQVERFAPDAPQSTKNEAVLRVAGYIHTRAPRPVQSIQVGGARLDFRERFYSPNAFVNSGAKSLLIPWRRRRALPVEEVE